MPFGPKSFRQLDLLGDTLLRIRHGAFQIAAAHAEFDRNVPLVVLPVDDEGTGLFRNRRQLFDGNPRAVRRADQNAPDAVDVPPVFRQKPHDQIEPLLPFVHLRDGLPADRRLDDVVHVADLQPVPRALFAIDLDDQIRLPHEMKRPEVPDPRHILHHLFDLGRLHFQLLQIVPVQLDRVFAFDARHRLLHVILNRLGEIEVDPGNIRQFLFNLFDQRMLRGNGGTPLFERFERDQELGVEEAGRIGSVVGTAQLRGHVDHLGVLTEDQAHFRRQLRRLFERDIDRHGRPHPDIAFLQRRHKLTADERHGGDRRRQRRTRAADHQPFMIERPAEHDQIVPLDPGHDPGIPLFDGSRDQEGAERRRQGKGHEQRPGERQAVGHGHGREDLARHAGHGKQRQKRHHDDRRRKKDRPAHFPRRPHHMHGHGQSLRALVRDVIEDALHHDERRIDDDAEVDRAERNQIRRFPAQHHD